MKREDDIIRQSRRYTLHRGGGVNEGNAIVWDKKTKTYSQWIKINKTGYSEEGIKEMSSTQFRNKIKEWFNKIWVEGYDS